VIDDNFEDFEMLDDDSPSNGGETKDEYSKEINPSDKKDRLYDLLEKKRIRMEGDGYNESLSIKRSYYSDDIFDD
jgi:hypothetical protein